MCASEQSNPVFMWLRRKRKSILSNQSCNSFVLSTQLIMQEEKNTYRKKFLYDRSSWKWPKHDWSERCSCYIDIQPVQLWRIRRNWWKLQGNCWISMGSFYTIFHVSISNPNLLFHQNPVRLITWSNFLNIKSHSRYIIIINKSNQIMHVC